MEEHVELLSFPLGHDDRLNVDDQYRLLRDKQPVARVQMPYGESGWLITRYADVKTVLSDRRFSRADSLNRDVPRTTPDVITGGIMAMDPPEHTRIRSLASQAFTKRRIERLRDQAEALAGQIITDALGGPQPVDLVEDFALPFTLTMICAMLGVPYSDKVSFRRWAEAGLATTSMEPDGRLECGMLMWDYMSGLVKQRRERSGDDLLSAIVAASADQPQVSADELVMLCMTILVAGYETTSTQLPNFAYVLLTRPQCLTELRERPEITASAVEELMRWIPLEAGGASPRYAREDVELSGTVIRAGDPVIASTVSANRDQRVFRQPDQLIFTRSPNPHLGFGFGPHHCLGSELARLQLEVGLAALIRNCPSLRLAVPEQELAWKSGMFVRGLARLPVAH